MKQIIFAGVGVIFVVLTSLIILTLQGGMIRKTKLENAVLELMEEYMEEACENYELRNMSEEEFIDWFTKNLSMRISEDGEYEVIVEKRDMKKGILSLLVNEKYKHIIGSQGSFAVSNTIIKEEEPVKELKSVSFYYPKEVADELRRPELIAKYTFQSGTEITVQNPPSIEGKQFLYWKDVVSNQIYAKEELQKVMIGFMDQSFVAVYQ